MIDDTGPLNITLGCYEYTWWRYVCLRENSLWIEMIFCHWPSRIESGYGRADLYGALKCRSFD